MNRFIRNEAKMAIWVVTGATGFVGRHVLDVLKTDHQRGRGDSVTVVALGRRRPDGWPADAFVAADLTEADRLRAAIEQVAPDMVIHTAGRTPPASDQELYHANFWATIHLLGALRALKRPVRVVLSGSAAELGPVDDSLLPVDESHPCNPANAYGRSKWLATLAGRSERSPLEVMVARVFNPIGPGTPTSQALGRFADLLSEPGADPVELIVGDLDARRDFIDVRDVANAMIALATRGKAGSVYNVGTGRSRRVGDGLDRLIHLSGRSVRVSVDPVLKCDRGPSDSRADITRITEHTGWKPMISWDRSLDDLWHEFAARRLPLRIDKSVAA
jgi:nucleoside-diphosphate-sugar epimerase